MWIDALLLLIVVLCACLAMLIKDLLKAVIALGVGSAALAAVFFLLGCPWYQPFADFIKLLAKEDVFPEAADERMCTALPLVAFAAVVPVGRAIYAFEGDLIVVAFLLWVPTLALSLAGWLSAGPFGLVGGMRALTQLFACEVPFLMALCAPALLAGSWSISEIAAFQNGRIWTAALQPIGFLVALTCLVGMDRDFLG